MMRKVGADGGIVFRPHDVAARPAKGVRTTLRTQAARAVIADTFAATTPRGSDAALLATSRNIGAALAADPLVEPALRQLTLRYLAARAYHQAAVLLAASGNPRLVSALETRLAEYMASPENVTSFVQRPQSPYQTSTAYDVGYGNGLKAIAKPLFDEALSDQHSLPRSANADVDAYRVDRRLGFMLVPLTTDLVFPVDVAAARPRGSAQLWVTPIPELDDQLHAVLGLGASPDPTTVNIAKLKVFDYLIGNTDRSYVFGIRNTVPIGCLKIAIDNSWSFQPKSVEPRLEADLDVVSPHPLSFVVAEAAVLDQPNGNSGRREVGTTVDRIQAFEPAELARMLEGRHHPESIRQAAGRLERLQRGFARTRELDAEHTRQPQSASARWQSYLDRVPV